MCKAEGMGLCPWGAIGGGKFKSEKDRRSQDGRQVQASDAEIKVSQVLEKIADRKNTAITSVALAYVMHKTPYVFPIVGGRKMEHLKGNIEALTLELSADDIKEIDGAVPFDLGFPHNFLFSSNQVPETPQDVWLIKMGANYDYVPEPKVGVISTSSEYRILTRASQLHRPREGSRASASRRFAGAGYHWSLGNHTGMAIVAITSGSNSEDGEQHGCCFGIGQAPFEVVR